MKSLCFGIILTVWCVLGYCSGKPRISEDATLSVPELIEKYGYPVEVHHVETEDGYILEMHRIPSGKNSGPVENKPIVFVQHGLLSSSADWIIAGPNKGLGYLLADKGYDVWLGNARGNTYSKHHKKYTTKQPKYWNFSWHEIGIYDLPSMIDYALEVSGQNRTFYIGHSQGTTSFYVMCSMRQGYNEKIRAMYSLAPIAYVSHVTNPVLQFVAQYTGRIQKLFELLGQHEFLPTTKFLAKIGEKYCSENTTTQWLCTNALFVLFGFNLVELNTELLPTIMGHTPAGASTKQFLHYGQLIKSGKFRQWDYGWIENTITYGSVFPPKYDLSKVTAPVALLYSHNDRLAAEIDVLKLYKELSNPIGRFLVTDKKFSHIDYLWAKHVDTIVYNKVFSLMHDF